MASVFPFRPWRSHPENIKKISCPPYDVIDSDEARALAENNPKSFLHIIRPEIDFPSETAFNDQRVYAKGAQNLQRFMDEKILIQEQEPGLYLYQLVWQGKSQIGIFGCVSVDEYDNEIILKHELTRPAKEDDRTKHILAQQAHAEPVMLTYNEQSEITNIQNEVVQNKKPLFHFEAFDGVTHTLWKLENTKPLRNAFEKVDHFYIADGHHRCKSASRAAQELRNKDQNNDEEAFNYFPAVVFPSSQMHILAYNRLVHHIPKDFLNQLKKRFEIKKGADPEPQKKGDISLYINDIWYGLELPEIQKANAVETLDVYRLQEFLLEPLLGVKDQRRDENISFVGGIRGTTELEQQVNKGEADLAISLYPTAIEELMTVSNEGLLMPPKSTWFEPKLRSGLLVHSF